jgi:hypothetical protein
MIWICVINRDHYTPLEETAIPTGEIAPVAGTPFDFSDEHTIRESIGQVPGGYDHNYVLFGMARQAKFIVKNGAASNTCAPPYTDMLPIPCIFPANDNALRPEVFCMLHAYI